MRQVAYSAPLQQTGRCLCRAASCPVKVKLAGKQDALKKNPAGRRFGGVGRLRSPGIRPMSTPRRPESASFRPLCPGRFCPGQSRRRSRGYHASTPGRHFPNPPLLQIAGSLPGRRRGCRPLRWMEIASTGNAGDTSILRPDGAAAASGHRPAEIRPPHHAEPARRCAQRMFALRAAWAALLSPFLTASKIARCSL